MGIITLNGRERYLKIYLTQLLVNLPTLPVSDLPDSLPDRWKVTQKFRLAAPQSPTSLP